MGAAGLHLNQAGITLLRRGIETFSTPTAPGIYGTSSTQGALPPLELRGAALSLNKGVLDAELIRIGATAMVNPAD
jgi:hypothetical protein